MELISFLVNFLAILGFIIIISYFISYLIEYFKKVSADAANKQINPPLAYMQNNGIRCPDYLSNTATTPNAYTCSNRDFNINVNQDTCSFKNTNNQLLDFPIIPPGKTWELGNPGGLKSLTNKEKWDFVRTKADSEDSMSRCDWIKKCGSKKGIDAVWQGVNKLCSTSDPAQVSF